MSMSSQRKTARSGQVPFPEESHFPRRQTAQLCHKTRLDFFKPNKVSPNPVSPTSSAGKAQPNPGPRWANKTPTQPTPRGFAIDVIMAAREVRTRNKSRTEAPIKSRPITRRARPYYTLAAGTTYTPMTTTAYHPTPPPASA